MCVSLSLCVCVCVCVKLMIHRTELRPGNMAGIMNRKSKVTLSIIAHFSVYHCHMNRCHVYHITESMAIVYKLIVSPPRDIYIYIGFGTYFPIYRSYNTR